MPPSAIRGTPVPSKGLGYIINGGELWHAYACNDMWCIWARADADFYAVSAVFNQEACGIAGGDVAYNYIDMRVFFLYCTEAPR